MRMETRRRRAVGLVGAVTVGAIVALFPLLGADAVTTASRVSGADRYATAAAVSAQAFSPGVSVAYLATGENFPDALAGAPAAAKGGGPVLLTRGTSLPSATATELDRLNPGKIVVLGGTNAVSQAVQDGLQQYTGGHRLADPGGHPLRDGRQPVAAHLRGRHQHGVRGHGGELPRRPRRRPRGRAGTVGRPDPPRRARLDPAGHRHRARRASPRRRCSSSAAPPRCRTR